MVKKLLTALIISTTIITSGCGQNDATTTSFNISQAADNFEILRRIVFINGITDSILLTTEGRCSTTADRADNQNEVTCKLGPNQYIRNV